MAKITMVFPDMWVTHYRVNRRTGQSVPAYYYNLKTRQRFSSRASFYRFFRRIAFQSNGCSKREEWLNRETAEQERAHICLRCKEVGHNFLTCPYPVIHAINPYEGRRIHRCSYCLRPGHNIRTCDRATAY